MEIDNFLPGSASLVEMVDKKLLISLRDGRHFYGILRTYDQFANLVLQDTVERIFLKKSKEYADIHHGVFLIRGENVVLVGEINEEEQQDEKRPELDTAIEKEEEKEEDGGVRAVGDAEMKADVDQDDQPVMPAPVGYTFLSDTATAQRKWELERSQRKNDDKVRNTALARLGFSIDVVEGDLY